MIKEKTVKILYYFSHCNLHQIIPVFDKPAGNPGSQ